MSTQEKKSNPPSKRIRPRQRRLERIARQMARIRQVQPSTAGEIEQLLHVSNSAARRLLGILKNEK